MAFIELLKNENATKQFQNLLLDLHSLFVSDDWNESERSLATLPVTVTERVVTYVTVMKI